ncbi:MAG: hypothetical protein ACKOW9_03950 [Candidatus Paceibacterota bacterium]
MKNIDTQKGAIPLVISILVVLAVIGGGAYLYTSSNDKKLNTEIQDVQTYTIDDPMFATSPKGIFLERNQALYDARSFEEMMAVSRKYDTEARQAENDKVFKAANTEKKEAYFSFAQALMLPNSEYSQISETLEGDTAIVTAFDSRKQKTTALFIKENGAWKIDSIKTMLVGSSQ